MIRYYQSPHAIALEPPLYLFGSFLAVREKCMKMDHDWGAYRLSPTGVAGSASRSERVTLRQNTKAFVVIRYLARTDLSDVQKTQGR